MGKIHGPLKFGQEFLTNENPEIISNIPNICSSLSMDIHGHNLISFIQPHEVGR